jgi:hypothetical protein
MKTEQSELEPIESVLFVSDNSALQQPVEERFRKLVEIWQSERPPSSHMKDLMMHPAYQQIIGLGPAVLPLLFREIEQNPDWWFWALRAITGASPEIPEESKGRLKDISRIWLAWGRRYGYIS